MNPDRVTDARWARKPNAMCAVIERCQQGGATGSVRVSCTTLASKVKLSNGMLPRPGPKVSIFVPSPVVAVMIRRADLPGLKSGAGERVADSAVTGTLSRRVRRPSATPIEPEPSSKAQQPRVNSPRTRRLPAQSEATWPSAKPGQAQVKLCDAAAICGNVGGGLVRGIFLIQAGRYDGSRDSG